MDIGIEKTLVGIFLQKQEIISEICHILHSNDFNDKRAGRIYSEAVKRFHVGEPFDLVLACELYPNDLIYLAEAHESIPINYIDYARKINENGRKTRIIDGMKKIIGAGLKSDLMLADLSKLHGEEIKGNRKSYEINSVTGRVTAKMAENKRRGRMPGIPTGFDFLHEHYFRYVPGHIWVITGFTSVGKSKLMIEKIERISRRARILVISTEMSEDQILTRIYARKTGINENVIISGHYGDSYQQSIDNAIFETRKTQIKIVDDVSELSEIEAIIQQESMTTGVDVVFLDYVQNCYINDTDPRMYGHLMAIRLQQLAKRAKTCIICFSQVSNSVGRGDVDQFEAKGAGEWAAVADVGVRLRRNKNDKFALLYEVAKGRHYQTIEHELRFSENFTEIIENK